MLVCLGFVALSRRLVFTSARSAVPRLVRGISGFWIRQICLCGCLRKRYSYRARLIIDQLPDAKCSFRFETKQIINHPSNVIVLLFSRDAFRHCIACLELSIGCGRNCSPASDLFNSIFTLSLLTLLVLINEITIYIYIYIYNRSVHMYIYIYIYIYRP